MFFEARSSIPHLGESILRYLYSFPCGIGSGGWAYSNDSVLRENLRSKDGFKTIGKCASLAELRSVEPTSSNQLILLDSPVAGGSYYYYDAGDVTTEDLGGGCVVTAGGRRWKLKHNGIISIFEFYPAADNVTDDSWAFQRACLFANYEGGLSIYVPPGTYRLKYPVYLINNTTLYGAGTGTVIVYEDPVFSKGRGGFVIGSSYEANRDTALANYRAGTYPGASTENTLFVNPAIGQYLRDNLSFTQSQSCEIHDLYLIAQYTGTNTNGGYGVNIVNALNSNAYNLWGDGWTQLIGMGSDTSPETPSNHNCHAWNLHVVNPNQAKTYYSIGFGANSTDCSIRYGWQHLAMTANAPNGSGVSINATENFKITDINIPNLGLTSSSEGVLINNSVNYEVDNIFIGGCKSGVSTYYTLSAYLDSTKPGVITNVAIKNATYGLSLRAKYATISGVTTYNVTNDVYFANSNASGNVLMFTPQSPLYSSSLSMNSFLANNTVAGWTSRKQYLRPAAIMVSDKASA
jgi:hypothetical protein